MKKKLAMLILATAITLSGCGSAASVDEPATQQQEQPATESSTTDQAQTASTESAPAQDATEAEAVSEDVPSSAIFKEVTRYYNKYYEGDLKEDQDGNNIYYKDLFEGSAQAVVLIDACKPLYPALYDALHENAVSVLKTADETADEYASTAAEDLEASVKDGYPFIGPYSDVRQVSIARFDDQVFSEFDTFYNFMGGAHGMYGLTGRSYDTQTGALLNLSDVISLTEEELNPILKEKLEAAAPEEDAFDDLDESLSHYKFNPKENDPNDYENYEYPYDWYLAHDGIHFYFGPYEIAAYAIGATEVVIGYDELKGQINEKYVPNSSKGYIVKEDLTITSSEWDDDTSDLHLVYEKEDPDADTTDGATCKSLALKLKDKSAKVDLYFDYNYNSSTITPYKVVTDDGKEYHYVLVHEFNDFLSLLVFEVTNDDVWLLGQEGFHYVYSDVNTDLEGEFVLTDPNNMYLGQTGDAFGTYTCYASYKVGDDGMPVLQDKEFVLSWRSQNAKSKKDLEVTVVDKDGNELSKETLPAGTHLVPLKTDSKSYMDFKLDDGRFIRINYTSMTYPVQIDGVDIDDLFDGLEYAG